MPEQETKKKLFRFEPQKEVLWAFLLGISAAAFSFTLNFTYTRLSFILLRDILQVGLIGLLIPTLLLKKTPGRWKNAGLNFEHPLRNILISLGLAVLFSLQFYFGMESGGESFALDTTYIIPAVYVSLINIFEFLFFCLYMNEVFSKSFGIIPAILLSALFYSFHHAGFQPEFLKLFFVGIFFMSLLRIFKSWLAVFPVYWVCALWDVLFLSSATGDIFQVDLLQVLIVSLEIAVAFFIIFSKKDLRLLKKNQ